MRQVRGYVAALFLHHICGDLLVTTDPYKTKRAQVDVISSSLEYNMFSKLYVTRLSFIWVFGLFKAGKRKGDLLDAKPQESAHTSVSVV